MFVRPIKIEPKKKMIFYLFSYGKYVKGQNNPIYFQKNRNWSSSSSFLNNVKCPSRFLTDVERIGFPKTRAFKYFDKIEERLSLLWTDLGKNKPFKKKNEPLSPHSYPPLSFLLRSPHSYPPFGGVNLRGGGGVNLRGGGPKFNSLSFRASSNWLKSENYFINIKTKTNFSKSCFLFLKNSETVKLFDKAGKPHKTDNTFTNKLSDYSSAKSLKSTTLVTPPWLSPIIKKYPLKVRTEALTFGTKINQSPVKDLSQKGKTLPLGKPYPIGGNDSLPSEESLRSDFVKESLSKIYQSGYFLDYPKKSESFFQYLFMQNILSYNDNLKSNFKTDIYIKNTLFLPGSTFGEQEPDLKKKTAQILDNLNISSKGFKFYPKSFQNFLGPGLRSRKEKKIDAGKIKVRESFYQNASAHSRTRQAIFIFPKVKIKQHKFLKSGHILSQDKIFINYKKPFLCYWLLPFLGLISVLPTFLEKTNRLKNTEDFISLNNLNSLKKHSIKNISNDNDYLFGLSSFYNQNFLNENIAADFSGKILPPTAKFERFPKNLFLKEKSFFSASQPKGSHLELKISTSLNNYNQLEFQNSESAMKGPYYKYKDSLDSIFFYLYEKSFSENIACLQTKKIFSDINTLKVSTESLPFGANFSNFSLALLNKNLQNRSNFYWNWYNLFLNPMENTFKSFKRENNFKIALNNQVDSNSFFPNKLYYESTPNISFKSVESFGKKQNFYVNNDITNKNESFSNNLMEFQLPLKSQVCLPWENNIIPCLAPTGRLPEALGAKKNITFKKIDWTIFKQFFEKRSKILPPTERFRFGFALKVVSLPFVENLETEKNNNYFVGIVKNKATISDNFLQMINKNDNCLKSDNRNLTPYKSLKKALLLVDKTLFKKSSFLLTGAKHGGKDSENLPSAGRKISLFKYFPKELNIFDSPSMVESTISFLNLKLKEDFPLTQALQNYTNFQHNHKQSFSSDYFLTKSSPKKKILPFWSKSLEKTINLIFPQRVRTESLPFGKKSNSFSVKSMDSLYLVPIQINSKKPKSFDKSSIGLPDNNNFQAGLLNRTELYDSIFYGLKESLNDILTSRINSLKSPFGPLDSGSLPVGAKHGEKNLSSKLRLSFPESFLSSPKGLGLVLVFPGPEGRLSESFPPGPLGFEAEKKNNFNIFSPIKELEGFPSLEPSSTRGTKVEIAERLGKTSSKDKVFPFWGKSFAKDSYAANLTTTYGKFNILKLNHSIRGGNLEVKSLAGKDSPIKQINKKITHISKKNQNYMFNDNNFKIKTNYLGKEVIFPLEIDFNINTNKNFFDINNRKGPKIIGLETPFSFLRSRPGGRLSESFPPGPLGCEAEKKNNHIFVSEKSAGKPFIEMSLQRQFEQGAPINLFLSLSNYLNLITKNIKTILNPYKHRLTYLPEINISKCPHRGGNITLLPPGPGGLESLPESFPLILRPVGWEAEKKKTIFKHSFPSKSEKIFLSFLSKAKKISYKNTNKFKDHGRGTSIATKEVDHKSTSKKYFKFQDFQKGLLNRDKKLKLKSQLKLNTMYSIISQNKKSPKGKDSDLTLWGDSLNSKSSVPFLKNFKYSVKTIRDGQSPLASQPLKKYPNLPQRGKTLKTFSLGKTFKEAHIPKLKLFLSKEIKLVSLELNQRNYFAQKSDHSQTIIRANHKAPFIETDVLNILTKKNNLKIKRRLKKMKKETRRRKKRKIFYPRPSWLTFSLYKKFLSMRYLPLKTIFLSKDSLNMSPKGYISLKDDKTIKFNRSYNNLGSTTNNSSLVKEITPAWSEINISMQTQSTPFEIYNRPKDFYRASSTVVTDLKRVLMKSNWLRNYLNSYFEKIKNIYQEMQNSSKKMELYFKLRDFILNLYAISTYSEQTYMVNTESREKTGDSLKNMNSTLNSTFLNVNNSFSNSCMKSFPFERESLRWGERFGNSFTSQYSAGSSNQNNLNNLTQSKNMPTEKVSSLSVKNSLDLLQYNRLTYQRIQRIIFSIKDNLNLNGEVKSRSKKLSKNIRSFIKRDYKTNSTLQRANESSNQNGLSNFWAKFIKNNILKFNTFTSYGYDELSNFRNAADVLTNFYFSSPKRKNIFWTLNKSNITLPSGSVGSENLYRSGSSKKLWDSYKIREISKSNRTKKIIFKILKLYGFLTNSSTSFDGFNHILESNYISNLSEIKQDNINSTECFSFNFSFFLKLPSISQSQDYGTNKPNLFFQEYPRGKYKLIPVIQLENKGNFVPFAGITNAVENIKQNHPEEKTKSSGFLRLAKKNDEGKSKSLTISNLDLNNYIFSSLPTKTYIQKAEQKLINIENKLKLLGLYSNKIEKTYKNDYYRHLKQELLKTKFWTVQKNVDFNFSPLNKKKEITFKENFSYRDKVNINNYSKISNNYFYWWTGMVDPKISLEQLDQKYSTLASLIKTENKVNPSLSAIQSLEPIFSFLFHFCTLISFISLGGIRTLVKFYFILISKISKIISNISLTIFENSFQLIFPQRGNTSKTSGKNNSNETQKKAINYPINFSGIDKFTPKSNSPKDKYSTNKKKKSIKKKLIETDLGQDSSKSSYDLKKVSISMNKTIKLLFLKFIISRNNKFILNASERVLRRSRIFKTGPNLSKELVPMPKIKKNNRDSQNNLSFFRSFIKNYNLLPEPALKLKQIPTYKYYNKDFGPENLGKISGKIFSSQENSNDLETNLLAETSLDSKRQTPYLFNSAGRFGQIIELWRLRMSLSLPALAKNVISNWIRLVLTSSPISIGSEVKNLPKDKDSALTLWGKSRIKSIDGKYFPLALWKDFTEEGKKSKLYLSYYSLLKVSNIFYICNKTSFYIYLLLLKSIDLFAAPISFIYKFFEKPGEYVVENLAYNFLVEWSADLITTIPDTVDVNAYLYFSKINLWTRPFILLKTSLVYSIFLEAHLKSIPVWFTPTLPILNFWIPSWSLSTMQITKTAKISGGINSSDALSLHNFNFLSDDKSAGLKGEAWVHPGNNSFQMRDPIKINFLFPFLFIISNTILKRILNSTFLIFIQQLCEPDLDYINRQKKGIIFWDIWGEYLKQVAEDNSINIYELTTDKEEQIKLLSKYEEIWKAPEKNRDNQVTQFHLYTGKIYKNIFYLKHHINNQHFNLKLFNKFCTVSQQTRTTPLEKSIINPLLQGRESFPVGTKLEGWGNQNLEISSSLVKRSSLTKFGYRPNNLGWNWLYKKPGNNVFKEAGVVSQFLSYQGKDTDLFIDLHPPKSFWSMPSLKYSVSVQQPLGSIVCQIFSGIFYKQISKNILVVGSPGLEKSLLIQAMAGETELKIITDNANRYALVYRGVAVGIKLLRDVFEALSLHTPCIFLIEDIHAIGERRPFLIDETSSNNSSEYNKNQSMQGILLKEKGSAMSMSREILYRSSKHLLSHYKKPYKEPRNLATNHFSFTFLFSNISGKTSGGLGTKIRNGDLNQGQSGAALSTQVLKKENQFKDKLSGPSSNNEKNNNWTFVKKPNLTVSELSTDKIPSISWGSFFTKQSLLKTLRFDATSKIKKIYSSSLEIKTDKSQLLAPPASSPFSVLILKEEKKLKHKKIVKEMPWFGLPGEQFSLVSKYNYSIRVKVALLADLVLSNLSVKLDMITDLLVIIDSVKGNRGFVVFATTHVPYILDPALRRPGRFDETISLPLISTLYTRWSNYRYNVKYLSDKTFAEASVLRKYCIPLNSTFNKGITLDLFKYNLIDQLSFSGLKEKNSYSSNQSCNELINYLYKKNSTIDCLQKIKTANRKFTNNFKIKKSPQRVRIQSLPLGLQNRKEKFPSSPEALMRAKILVEDMSIIPSFKNQNQNQNQISNKQLLKLKSKNYSFACKSIISFLLFTLNNKSKNSTDLEKSILPNFSTDYSLAKDFHRKSRIDRAEKTNPIKWIGILKDANIFGGNQDYSVYLSLFGYPLMLKIILTSLIGGKIGESFLMNSFNRNHKVTFNSINLIGKLSKNPESLQNFTDPLESFERLSKGESIPGPEGPETNSPYNASELSLRDSSKMDSGKVSSVGAFEKLAKISALPPAGLPPLPPAGLPPLPPAGGGIRGGKNGGCLFCVAEKKEAERIRGGKNGGCLFCVAEKKEAERIRSPEDSKKNVQPLENLFLFNFDSTWKHASSLLFSYLQKRQSSMLGRTTKNITLFGHTSKLLSFNNKYSLMEAPNPPISNILLPSKRFENYKKTFNNQFEVSSVKNTYNASIFEKLQLHQQQRLLRRLYKYPIKEFFKSEILNTYLSNDGILLEKNTLGSPDSFSFSFSRGEGKPLVLSTEDSENLSMNYVSAKSGAQALTNFNNSYLTLAPLEKTNLTAVRLTRLSSTNWCYKNLLYNRHRTYLTNQWWNGQQGEHNVETTFLSDIDWRYTFVPQKKSTNSTNLDTVSGSGDVNIDFPDSEQFYNPRNRRWFLTNGDWNYWFNIQSELKDIYNHYIYDCFAKAYKYLDKNREIIDFYSELLHQMPLSSPTGLNERELLNLYKRFLNQ